MGGGGQARARGGLMRARTGVYRAGARPGQAACRARPHACSHRQHPLPLARRRASERHHRGCLAAGAAPHVKSKARNPRGRTQTQAGCKLAPRPSFGTKSRTLSDPAGNASPAPCTTRQWPRALVAHAHAPPSPPRRRHAAPSQLPARTWVWCSVVPAGMWGPLRSAVSSTWCSGFGAASSLRKARLSHCTPAEGTIGRGYRWGRAASGGTQAGPNKNTYA